MIWLDWLKKWKMTNLRINAQFLTVSLEFNDADRHAAWEMYIELLTRITTQPLAQEHGDEATALASIHSLFPTTRNIIKKHGRDSLQFTKLAIIVLNQIIRPFTAKWHKLSLAGAFDDPIQCAEFRGDMAALQGELRRYTGMLGDMAGVEEDLLLLEQAEEDAVSLPVTEG